MSGGDIHLNQIAVIRAMEWWIGTILMCILLVGCTQTTTGVQSSDVIEPTISASCSSRINATSCEQRLDCRYACTGGWRIRGSERQCVAYTCIPQLCENLTGWGIDWDLIMDAVEVCKRADGRYGPVACTWMNDQVNRDRCYAAVAISHHNASLCGNVSNESLRTYCDRRMLSSS